MALFQLNGYGLGMFIGTNPQQIFSTIDSCFPHERGNWLAPDYEDRIVKREKTGISCYVHNVNLKHWLKCKVREDFIMGINANAYALVVNQIPSLKEQKYAEHYRLKTSWHPTLLPLELVDAIQQYDWEKHKKKVEEWMSQQEDNLRKMTDVKYLSQNIE